MILTYNVDNHVTTDDVEKASRNRAAVYPPPVEDGSRYLPVSGSIW